MRERPLLGLERTARDLIGSVAPSVLGARIRRERIAQKMSIRDLAAAANLGANSIVRLEAGMGFRPVTLVKVCEALGLHLDRIGSAELDVVAEHRRSDDRWHELSSYSGGYLGGSDGFLTQAQRADLVKDSNFNPLMLLKSRLTSGKMLPTLIEVYHPTEARSHPGEEFVFALRGPVLVTVAGRDYRLETGESMDFWGTELHSYGPVDELPGLLLSVRVNP